MTIDLSPVVELDIDQELLDFASENYCANCTHFKLLESESIQGSDGISYCEYWDDETRIESGMICAEYVPQGYE